MAQNRVTIYYVIDRTLNIFSRKLARILRQLV